jgi:predicted secreted hydrolase
MTDRNSANVNTLAVADRMAHRASGARAQDREHGVEQKKLDGDSFPYWEGPISFSGRHRGVGYLEMTGY